jgi:Asp-tRNA(Asn)/Glu-tRNA(Gln) amidotransferase A subunit family amidase
VRIGVIREYMNKKLYAKADEESIDIVERALGDLRKLGATIVDPGPEGALFQSCVTRYAPQLYNAAFAAMPENLSLRNLGGGGLGAQGEGKFMMNKYLRERGDANIRSNADLISKATFYSDPNFPDRKQQREAVERQPALDNAVRLQNRFAIQSIVLQCMEEQKLDALVAPTATIPAPKLNGPREPNVNGRSPVGWSLIGQQGFPVMTVPAGFTTEVWDRVRDGGLTRLIGPIAARLPVGVDFYARPFGEPTLFRIASAYERATKHRTPPRGFGPLPGEP